MIVRAAAMDERERQWLAAALAALAGRVRLSTFSGGRQDRPEGARLG